MSSVETKVEAKNNEDLVNKALLKRKIGVKDKIRQARFILLQIRANLKYVIRNGLRDIWYLWKVGDMIIFFVLVILVILMAATIIIVGLPLIVSLFDPVKAYKTFYLGKTKYNGLDDFLLKTFQRYATDPRIGLGAIAAFIGFEIRVMVKAEIYKFRDKVKGLPKVIYVFGSTPYAKQIVEAMTFRWALEERVVLIADKDLLWVRRVKLFINAYIITNRDEFRDDTLYKQLQFKNAEKFLILTESAELNQDIMTRVLEVKPDAQIVMLSQYAPTYLHSGQQSHASNITIIDDLSAIVENMMVGMSLDIKYPPCLEIEAPHFYYGKPALYLTEDSNRQVEVIRILRNETLLPPTEIVQKGDRLLIYHRRDWETLLVNRIINEITLKKKQKKQKRTKKEKPKEDGKKEVDSQ